MDDWCYIFEKVCDGSFKGPRELQRKISGIKGELKSISEEHVPALEVMLRNSIQHELSTWHEYFENKESGRESNRQMRSYYQHYFDNLIWQLRNDLVRFDQFELKKYLGWVQSTFKSSIYSVEPMLRMFALVAYNSNKAKMKPVNKL